ncbi:outer spore coat protein CotE [Brevibacillus dissolubilis]|uniref:outer spore coat protein CotE n=1 Tax=Brevibacillus dissolubilis TaxID=1844116 RepID=UPI0011173E49|nr:outer spore coat protein CotE [Brevibacillus dissolubilis]
MSGTDKDMQCRELIAKAVCGRGHKFSQMTHTITPANTPSTILGCWIINNTFQAEKVGSTVEVRGSYDVNLWYSFADNTQTEVTRERVNYTVVVPLSFFDKNCRGDLDVHAHSVEQPKCVRAEIVGGDVRVRVEQEYAVEIIGETKICVVVCDSCHDHKEDFSGDYDESHDDFDDFDSADLLDDLD